MVHRPSVISEFFAFLKENKKWWMIPLLIIVALLAIGVSFSGSPVAPFIYTLF